ncbi:hypothetical protein PI95_000535 [Hassallia byssoidea VB512170]|uniref:Uncharacterized protein n=1 Tax=Hassallia byssoidea VB512170 TaxID=1304833 RepID=A0A846H3B5_9CYAN|nr:YwqJ-related putative deaminase [Hassalia byssoidea]NEU71100.1 hypothetical protein [Hassalia byssoidea VB512170]
MRSKTKKSVSRLVGIWTFLLLLIFKGIFPKPAYAFLSSLDACAANPECAAAISSEVAPAVSAPTGAGFGASTLSTTTAAGATSSSVQAVAEISVAARLGTLGILYYWNQSQNDLAQNKAKQKYCAANPSDSVCGFAWNVTGQGLASGMPYCELSGVFYPRTLYATSISFSSSTFTDGPFQDCPKDIVVLDDQLSPENFFAGTATFTKISDPPQWKDWPQEKRNAAVQLLNNSDWQSLINSMPSAGVLNPGDKINAPFIVIPGEETDDPNTPADERLLRKEHGFFTFPGRNDFDYDADGTADSADPEPQNPSVPTASSGSSGSSSDPSSTLPDSNEPLDTSQEPRPEPLSEIPETARAKDLAEAKAAELYENLGKKAPTATAVAVDTETGKVYYGTSGKPLPTTIDEYLAERMPVPSEEPWEVSNCAEFKAVNDALLDGANIRDLEVHTVRTKTGQAYPRCRNCRKTIDGPNVTSDP